MFQNPPWQFVSFNESGHPTLSGGVVMDILEELSRKLNFTYTVIVAQTNIEYVGNLTEDGNNTVIINVFTKNCNKVNFLLPVHQRNPHGHHGHPVRDHEVPNRQQNSARRGRSNGQRKAEKVHQLYGANQHPDVQLHRVEAKVYTSNPIFKS